MCPDNVVTMLFTQYESRLVPKYKESNLTLNGMIRFKTLIIEK
jgi:hypothetical protein